MKTKIKKLEVLKKSKMKSIKGGDGVQNPYSKPGGFIFIRPNAE